MPQRVVVAETQLQPLKGEFPDVPTYAHVDTALLYEGDESSPFHVVLPIAEIGRVSDNGLEYDEELVTAIAEQMSSGAGGIRGHIPDDQLSTSYPIDAVHWIGHLQVGKTLWAKGYIPPGPNREDIRMKKARGGNIATSIFGDAIRQMTDGSAGVSESTKRAKPTWKAREFQLEQIDLAPTKRAALKNKHGFVITREMEGDDMPEIKDITVADVPENIREMIIAESEAGKKLQRLAEMESKIAEQDTQIAELRQYASIVAEIRTTIGKDTDTVAAVAEYHNALTKLAEMLGVKEYASISVKVEEMHEKVAEFAKVEFERAVDGKVAELTNWNVTSDAAKEKVAKFRGNFRRNVLAGLGSERAVEKIAETAQALWDDEYSVLGAALVAEMGGPAAIVGGKDNPKPEGSGSSKITDEELKKNAQQYAHAKS